MKVLERLLRTMTTLMTFEVSNHWLKSTEGQLMGIFSSPQPKVRHVSTQAGVA